jgi:hypothetical protein
LASEYLKVCDRYGVHLTCWVGEERQVWGGYWLTLYRNTPNSGQRALSEPYPGSGARTLEMHLATGGADVYRGINVADGTDETAAPFHNRNLGNFSASGGPTSHNYWYPGLANDGPGGRNTFSYLASRGHTMVRVGFRWERMMRDSASQADVDSTEFARVEASINAAGAAGLKVVLDCHNYGKYLTSSDGTASGSVVSNGIGGAAATKDDFVNLWRMLARRLHSNTNLWAYGLMNEPSGLVSPYAGDRGEARWWEECSQAAVDAIRAEEAPSRHPAKWISVMGLWLEGLDGWEKIHPHKWITDPTGKHVYEAHDYFDSHPGGGQYHNPYRTVTLRGTTYTGEATFAQADGC